MIRKQWVPLVAAFLLAAGCSGTVPQDEVVETMNWPGHGNGPDESGYSPLAQINTDNVDALGLVWSLDLPGETTLEATPIQVDGTIYFTGTRADIYAVDALTGELKWKHEVEAWRQHTNKMKFIFHLNRGCAYDNGKIFSATPDGRLIALDAKTGAELWSVMTLEPDSPSNITGAPRTFDGKVMIGQGGGDVGVRGYVTAYDQQTGKQVWRFYVAPGSPDENAGDPAMERAAETWDGEYWKTGTGGAPWDGLTYDPELDQVYIGTGNSGPYNPAMRSPGDGDNLYLTSIVAVDADSGEYKWHYQQNPREAWDYKSTMNMVTADLEIDGEQRPVLMQVPTNGFFYVLDRRTGELLSAEKVGKVTWAERIDLETGRPVEIENVRYENGPVTIWPSVIGAHNWMPMAYSPASGLAYIPYMQLGMKFTAAPETYSGVVFEPVFEDERDGRGSLIAWDPVTQRQKWRVDHDWMWNGGAMATAGGLVFQGTADGWFSAYDAESGERLWRFNAGLGIISQPISYAIDGTQYVALLVGYGAPNPYSMPTMNPGWQFGAQPRRLMVFKLGGTAKLAPTAPACFDIEPLDDPELELDPAQVAAGEQYFGACTGCHGGSAISSGMAPDLRASAIAMDRDALFTVLTEGVYLPQGMPKYDDYSRERVNAIHAYIRDRARANDGADRQPKTKAWVTGN